MNGRMSLFLQDFMTLQIGDITGDYQKCLFTFMITGILFLMTLMVTLMVYYLVAVKKIITFFSSRKSNKYLISGHGKRKLTEIRFSHLLSSRVKRLIFYF